MSSLGVYFGPKGIEIVETKGKKILNHSSIPQSAISAGELEEKVPIEVKVIEIIALLKDEFRKSKIEAGEATISLSGRDLIIRNFEIPLLPKEELHSAINFEVKKYIPFRVEDLISDFQLKYDKSSHANLVLFMGVKKDVLDKYISILSQLDLKITAIEYSAFSLIRCLKLAGLRDTGVVGILGADLSQEDEVNFTVLEDGFPLFSRDIALVGGHEEFPGAPVTEAGANLEKLKTEIRISLDYYHRKFPQKNIKKIFLVSSQEQRPELEALITEASLSVRFIDISKFIGKPVPYSLSFLKGYSSSLSKIIRTHLKVNLLAAQQRAKIQKAQPLLTKAVPFFMEGLSLDFRFVLIGLLICIATYGFGLYRIRPIQKGIKEIVDKQVKVAAISPVATYEELSNIHSEYQSKLKMLDKLVKEQLYLTKPLEVIPRAIPKGMWLTNFNFNQETEDRANLTLQGVVYLVDADKEFESVNKFISNLREDPEFLKYFKEVSLISLSRDTTGTTYGRAVTDFSISCKTYQGEQ